VTLEFGVKVYVLNDGKEAAGELPIVNDVITVVPGNPSSSFTSTASAV
jgi:hypothetical protein